jgi:alkylresorcinol/alkylpyrone synthase
MPTIAAVATAVPPYCVPQTVARAYAREFFHESIPDVDRYLTVFDHAAIDSRYLSAPVEWFLEPHSFGEANDLFIDMACRLGEESARRCLAQAGVTPDQIDHLIFIRRWRGGGAG